MDLAREAVYNMVPLRCPPLHTVTSSLARVVSKPTHGLTNLNQVHICAPSLNLTGVIESESMASQAFCQNKAGWELEVGLGCNC